MNINYLFIADAAELPYMIISSINTFYFLLYCSVFFVLM